MGPQTFHLLEIIREEDYIKNCAADSALSQASPAIRSPTFLIFEVGPEARRYRCPIYILEASSVVIQKLLANQLSQTEKGTNTSAAVGEDEKAADVVPRLERKLITDELVEANFLTTSNATIRLPDVRELPFETVALYLEHFYGVTAASPAGDPPPGKALFTHELPTHLTPPVKLQDLYGLTGWEQGFVLERLVRWRESRLAALGPVPEPGAEDPDPGSIPTMGDILRYNGAWVDALGTPFCRSAPSERLQVREPRAIAEHSGGSPVGADRAARNTSPKASPSYIISFTLEEKQNIMSRLCETLHAAKRLGVVSLQHLCAALIANMVARLNEEDARFVVAKPVDGTPQCIPPMTAKHRAELLQRHPWLESVLKEKEK